MGNDISEDINLVETQPLKQESKKVSKHVKTRSVIAPSGFRMSSIPSLNSLASAVSSPDVELDVDYVIEEMEEIKQESEELLHVVSGIAEKHGLISGDFKFIKEDNMLLDITLKFTYRKQLGDGASCRVLLVTDNKNNTQYALKEMIANDKYNPKLFKKEIRLLTELNHPNILKYHQSYIDPHNFYIATQYLTGGDLYERCKQTKKFTELVASQIIHTVIEAVAYMHSKGIVHRDLKPGNIVFDKPGPNGKLYIIDFGDSATVVEDEIYNEFVGTIYYVPPEITRYRHGWELKKGDLWAIGVITYQLLCGLYPFSGSSNREIMKKIKKEDFVWPQDIILSKHAKVFIRSLLQRNARARSSAADALKHKWFCNAFNVCLGKTFAKTMDFVVKAARIRFFMANRLFSEMDEKERELIVDTFKSVDYNNKGYIVEKDIVKWMMGMNMKENHAKIKARECFQTFDTENSGKLKFDDIASSQNKLFT